MAHSVFNERKEQSQKKDIFLAEESAKAFYNACKCGIYKEMNRKKLITDTQLNQLLGQLE